MAEGRVSDLTRTNLEREMKKKPAHEFKSYEGWTALTGVRGYCKSCGALRDFHEVLYWCKDGERTKTSCEDCLTK